MTIKLKGITCWVQIQAPSLEANASSAHLSEGVISCPEERAGAPLKGSAGSLGGSRKKGSPARGHGEQSPQHGVSLESRAKNTLLPITALSSHNLYRADENCVFHSAEEGISENQA